MNVLALGGARGTVTMTNLKPDHPFFSIFQKLQRENFKKGQFLFWYKNGILNKMVLLPSLFKSGLPEHTRTHYKSEEKQGSIDQDVLVLEKSRSISF